MAADHSARGSMKTGVKPETVCELQDTNDHRQVERKWRLPISVGELSTLEGRLNNLFTQTAVDVRQARPKAVPSRGGPAKRVASSQVPPDCAARAASTVSRAASHALISLGWTPARWRCESAISILSTSGVLDYALNLSISLSAGKETKWDSPSNGE